MDLLSNGPLNEADLVHSPLLLGASKSRNALDSTPIRLKQVAQISKQESCDDDELLLADGIDSSCKKRTNNLLQLSPSDIMASDERNESDQWSKYRVKNILGEGSYGKVYKVQRVPQTTRRIESSALNSDLMEPQTLTANSKSTHQLR